MDRPVRVFLLMLAALLSVGAHLPLGWEVAERHANRAGEHLARLRSIRAEGRTFLAGEIVSFTLYSERPNRLRVESFTARRRVIQAYDGANPPWISHSENRRGQCEAMVKGDAEDFITGADFDGPLVNFAAKGYTVDYAGVEEVGGRRATKLLLMNPSREPSFLWVDAETHEIVKRLVYRVRGGERVEVETFFGDFRPVAGVPQPHRIETLIHGDLLYVMQIDTMAPNVEMPAELFERP